MQTRSITTRRKSDGVLAMRGDKLLSREMGRSCCAGWVFDLDDSHVSIQSQVGKKVCTPFFIGKDALLSLHAMGVYFHVSMAFRIFVYYSYFA